MTLADNEFQALMRLKFHKRSESQILEAKRTEICWTNYPAKRWQCNEDCWSNYPAAKDCKGYPAEGKLKASP
jgi:hypothetical protein